MDRSRGKVGLSVACHLRGSKGAGPSVEPCLLRLTIRRNQHSKPNPAEAWRKHSRNQPGLQGPKTEGELVQYLYLSFVFLSVAKTYEC